MLTRWVDSDHKHLKTEEEINQAIRLGEFIKQGLDFSPCRLSVAWD